MTESTRGVAQPDNQEMQLLRMTNKATYIVWNIGIIPTFWHPSYKGSIFNVIYDGVSFSITKVREHGQRVSDLNNLERATRPEHK